MLPFATNPLQPLIDVFQSVLVFFHDSLNFSWGWSIVALTVVIRALLLPLALRQFRSMQSLARHQPELKRLQEKYKGDKDRMNQEMMKFYRENKINPLASCLPLAAQIPVFISLYYMLRKDLRHQICPDVNALHAAVTKPCGPNNPEAHFLFIHDLTNNATGGVLIALIVLYVGSQLVSTVMSTVSSDRNQKLIMYALPFFFVTFVVRFPAGLLVYWITTNLWTILQQLIIRRRLGPMRPPHEPSEKKDDTGGGLAARLGLPARTHTREPAPVGVSPSSGGSSSSSSAPKRERPTGPPPSPPRKKKKRSGRRR